MNKFKHAADVQQENTQALPVAAFSQSDIDAMFVQTGEPMQLAVLSQQEMKETDGAYGPFGAAIGGLGGAGGYFLRNQIGGTPWSTGDFAYAVATGAAAGAIAGPVGVVWGFNRNLAAGMAYGVYDRHTR